MLDAGAGGFHVAGAPASAVTWPRARARLDGDGRLGELRRREDFQADAPTFPFGAHVAVVEVDTETGAVELRVSSRWTTPAPSSIRWSPRARCTAGVATGVAQALFEEVVYDEEGNPLTASFLGYAFPSAAELPSLGRVEMETPTPLNVLGAKGIGESGTIGSTPAVQSAVIDALAPFGVRHVDMPANGERVWRALREAAASTAAP